MILFQILIWSTLTSLLIILLRKFYGFCVLTWHLRQLPGPPPTNFIVGNISPFHDTPDNVFKTLRRFALQYYPIYHVWAFHISVVNVFHPQDMETILASSKHTTKSFFYKITHQWLGMGLLTSTGTKWQTRRKILTPAFHFNILQDFIGVFNEETMRLVETLLENCHNDFIDVSGPISEFTLNSIAETAMGVKFAEESPEAAREYKAAIHEIGKIYFHRSFRPWLVDDFIYGFDPASWREKKLVKILHKFTTDVIQKREKQFNNSVTTKRKRLAMLDLLIKMKQEEGIIDDEGIREEVDTFMFEGHDTTSVALCFILMLIANHKKIQEEIVQEMGEVLGTLDKKPDYNDLQKLKFMERCIKESLRIYPSVPFIGRVLDEDIICSSGHRLKSGSIMHMHVYDIHHNSELYPDPEKFDPDRFLSENTKDRHPFAYLPFSAGPRNCIGQRFAFLELKAALCGILAHFILEPVDTPDSIVLVCDIVLRTKDGIKVKFLPRK